MQQHNEVELSALGMGNVAFGYIHISENLFIQFSSFPKFPFTYFELSWESNGVTM